MIKAAILDMDGLLIDSEPFWQEAEVATFRKVGIHLTTEMCQQTMGIRIDEVVDYYYRRYPWNPNKYSRTAIREAVVEGVIKRIHLRGAPKPGVQYILEYLSGKEIKLALASSSDMKIIEAVLKKLNIQSYFMVIHSAEFEQYGKPHPATYLTTAEKLLVSPIECLCLEDSIYGLISAKAAKMQCVVVPDSSLRDDKRLGIADAVLPSLREFDDRLWDQINETL